MRQKRQNLWTLQEITDRDRSPWIRWGMRRAQDTTRDHHVKTRAALTHGTRMSLAWTTGRGRNENTQWQYPDHCRNQRCVHAGHEYMFVPDVQTNSLIATGGSRFIRTCVQNWPKFSQNHLSIPAVLFCPLNSKFAQFERILLNIIFSN